MERTWQGIPLIVYAQARVERTRKIINYSECVGSVGALNVHSLRLLGTLRPMGTRRVKYTGTMERFLLRERKSLLDLRVGRVDSIGSLRKLWFPKGCLHCGSERCRHRLCASCLECVRSKWGKFWNFTKNLLDTLGRRIGSRRSWRRLAGIRQWLGWLMAYVVTTGVGCAHKTAEHGSIQVTESGPDSVPARVESGPRRLKSARRRVGEWGRLAAGAATTSS